MLKQDLSRDAIIEKTTIRNRAQLLSWLRDQLPVLQAMGIESLAIFGSFARDEVTEQSDLDILVTFREPPTFDSYFNVLFHLEDRINRKVDLVTHKTMREEIWATVYKDLLYVT